MITEVLKQYRPPSGELAEGFAPVNVITELFFSDFPGAGNEPYSPGGQVQSLDDISEHWTTFVGAVGAVGFNDPFGNVE